VPDAIVIGAGPNGLVAANLLADAGWDVHVLEAASEPGGAVRSAELTLPGYTHDVFSAFYPLAIASPAIGGLDLGAHGLRWRHGELVLAHPASDGTCVALSRDLEETAASLDAFAPGDGDAWRRLFALWERVEDGIAEALVTPFPPIRPGLQIAAALRRDLGRFLRLLALPVRRLAAEEFRGEGGARLLLGNAMHADLAPEVPPSGAFGWVLSALGQRHGFPTPEGGAGELTAALVRRLRARGGTLTCDARVTRVEVRRGVRLAGGEALGARAVLADVAAPALYRELVGAEHLPARLLEDLRRFQYDLGTVKVDWALAGPIPWRAEPARRAGVVHVADGMDEVTDAFARLARGALPDTPFLVVGQYAAVDPTRSPPGTDTAWAYTHVPRELADVDGYVARIESRVDELAPGFTALIRARHALGPADFAAHNANLDRGSMHGGTAQLHQQAIFRPTPGLGRPETPIRRLYLASSSAHPGGGVHGGPGAAAARVALVHARTERFSISFAQRRRDL
jgi:phytoene dehydrogenase-like protein